MTSNNSGGKPKAKAHVNETTSLWLGIGATAFVIVAIIGFASPHEISPLRWGLSMLAPLPFMYQGIQKKKITISGAASGWAVAALHGLSDGTIFIALMVFFLSASRLTRLHSSKKEKLEEDFKHGGQRNWIQVVCNCGPAMVFSIALILFSGPGEMHIDFAGSSEVYLRSLLVLGAIAGYACCNGDTWASEVGTVLNNGQDPFLITTFGQVPTGTNGGVSAIGLFASLLGGLLIGLCHWGSICAICQMNGTYQDVPPQWPVVVTGAVVGLYGSVLDSVLGATLQFSGWDVEAKLVTATPGKSVKHISGIDLLDNHHVNLLSASVSAVVVALVSPYIWPAY